MSERTQSAAIVPPEGVEMPEEIKSAAQNVVASTGSATGGMGKRSYFEDDESRYAGSLTMSDGEIFWFNKLSEEALKIVKGAPQRIEQELGLTPEQVKGTSQELTAQERQAAKLLGIPEENVLVFRASLTPEQSEKKDAIELEVVHTVLKDALKAWTLDVHCTDERKVKLHLDVKALLSERIAAFSRSGETESRFHKRIGNRGS